MAATVLAALFGLTQFQNPRLLQIVVGMVVIFYAGSILYICKSTAFSPARAALYSGAVGFAVGFFNPAPLT